MKNVYIERQSDFLRICISHDKKLVECYIEEEDRDRVSPGQIYKGIVRNIVPAIKCAFVDIGTGKNAYMYLDSRLNNLSVKKGQELLVEIVKESMGSKGPKVNNNITVPGRYSVIDTLDNNMKISKKLTDKDLQEKFKSEIKKPFDAGIMIRTNAKNVSIDEINMEISQLYKIYKNILKKSEIMIKPNLLYDAGGPMGRVLRDSIDRNTSKVVVTDKNDYDFISDYFKEKYDIKTEVELYKNSIPIMEYYDIENEILNLRDKNVKLDCGGYLVIDKTEAMYVIDVNSGKNLKGRNIEKTAEITDLDAAAEIARQVRLRNLSGIIVIDFIDIQSKIVKEKILKTLNDGFRSDKNKTIIYPFTELNLVQIARRRRGKSILSYIDESCSCCFGKGTVLKFSYLKHLLMGKVLRISEQNGIDQIYIELGNAYKKQITDDTASFINDIGAKGKVVYLKYVNDPKRLKVEPVAIKSEMQELAEYKIYG
ncbi:MAG: ribonuclease E/G [Clostridium sp.]|nr:ribonuclease E/G [Clostridium sp.]